MSHAHAARGGMSQPPPPPPQQQQTPKEERQSKSTQPDLFRQPQSTMTTTAKSQSTRNLPPTIPSLEINRGTVSCPSLRAEISSLSLDDAPSTPSLPVDTMPQSIARHRPHGVGSLLPQVQRRCVDRGTLSESGSVQNPSPTSSPEDVVLTLRRLCRRGCPCRAR